MSGEIAALPAQVQGLLNLPATLEQSIANALKGFLPFGEQKPNQ
jgi:hypothetical protein